ncbi:CDP-archaeol synthase [Mangrovimonas sp. YM274]|uniref:CDP-archaeol synthase n=1 Tax=Mangrovimonas sp. YM274 TaxID=3070660 RepID=UPI0027DDA9C1|nr:CDP-archaeol synthase [Mangrovimonas sp. YM274]WMI68254.1 CDP-archaeol synthase [Mangrovimonas sp. YM274]
MAKKIGILILVIFLSIILASIYGFLHNQVSYSISTEYFTKFKFDQFWSVKYTLDFPRMSAGLIGIASTWWFGLILGLIIGIVGMFQWNPKVMWKSSIGAIIRTLVIAIGIGIVGILIGKFIISNLNTNWNLPVDLMDQKSFLIAGTMHNFSYRFSRTDLWN